MHIFSKIKIERKNFYFIFIIIAVSLVLRMFFLEDYKKTEVFNVFPYTDSYFYSLRADDINAGDFLNPRIFISWPLYAYFLALLFKISYNSALFVYVLQFFLGIANLIIIYFIGKKVFNEKVGFIAALLCSWQGLFIFYEGLLMYTSLSLFLNSLFLLFLLYFKDRLNNKLIFLIGIFLGICAITQANIIIFGILAVLFILWQNKIVFTKAIRLFSLFSLGLSMVLGAITALNYFSDRDLVLISRNSGLNFFLGNNPEATGAFHCPVYFTSNQEGMFKDAKVIARIKLGRDIKSSEMSSFWIRKSLEFMKDKPQAFLKLLIRKIYLLFNPREFICDPEYKFVADKIGIFKIMFMDLGFLLPLGLLGIFLNTRNLKKTALIYLMLIAFSFSMLVFFVTAKHRLATVPFLAIFAASALFNIWEAIKKKDYARFGLLSAVLISIFLFLNFNINKNEKQGQTEDNFFKYLYYMQKAGYYHTKSDYNTAMEELKKAYELRPNSHYVIFSYGILYYNMNDFVKAEEKFKEAIKVFPFYIDAYYNLGFMYFDQGRFEESARVLKKAEFLDPEDTGIHFELGKAYKALKKNKEAKEEFGLALKKINHWRNKEIALIKRELADLP